MADLSKIEWLFNPFTSVQGASWNRWWGCTHESPACDNCYIPRTPPLRMRHLKFDRVAAGGKTGIVMADPKVLLYPLQWRKSRMIFVESLGDLWDGTVNIRNTAQMYAVMLLAPWHVFITLTKRTKRMRNWLRSPKFCAMVATEILQIAANDQAKVTVDQAVRAIAEHCPYGRPIRLPAWIWTGTTVEDNAMAALRIPLLLDLAAFTDGPLWLSCEPLTNELADPLDLTPYLRPWPGYCQTCGATLTPAHAVDCAACGASDDLDGDADQRRFARPDWVVFGGESGPAAKATGLDIAPAPGLRPIDLDNLWRLIEQSKQAGLATFVKQLGEPWARTHYDKDGLRMDKAGRVIDEWPISLQVREYPLALAQHTLTVDPDNQLALAALQPRSVLL